VVRKLIISVSVLLICANTTLAQSVNQIPQASDWQVLLQLDNDLFSGSDRDYTNGVRIGFVQEIPLESDKGQRMNKRLSDGAKKIQGRLQSLRIPDDANLRFARGFGVSQLMFTPENPFALSAPEGERPYAGWLGLEYSLHVKTDNLVNSLTLAVGSTGESSLAQPAQNWVHRNISNSPIFQGWDSQVPSELTLNIHFDHKQRTVTMRADWLLATLERLLISAALPELAIDYRVTFLPHAYNLAATGTNCLTIKRTMGRNFLPSRLPELEPLECCKTSL